MKLLLSGVLFLAAFSTQALAQNNSQEEFEERYSSASYPYDLLIRTADTIKIIYTTKGPEVECSVVLEDGKLHERSATLVVSKQQFEQEPLANCLVRDEAKKWLALTF